MATAPKAPTNPNSQLQNIPPQIVTIKLFKSWHAGYGESEDISDTKRVEGYRAIIETPVRYSRAHGSIDARWPGQIRAGLQVKKVSTQSHDLRPVFGVEWVDTSNNIYPAIYYIVGKKIMMIRFGVVTTVTSSLTANATGGMFDDDGSGVPYLYACYGGASTASKIQRMNVSGTITTSADVVAGLLLSLNGDAYRTLIPTGGTSACQVSKCPYGSDRFTNANWGAGVTVGRAGTSINVLTSVRNAPVAIKPEGVFAYNQGLDRWVNYAKSWEQFAHGNNGIGAFPLGDSLIIPMGDGGSVIFDGNSVQPFDPGGLLSTPGLHTTRDKFSTSAAMRHWLIGATQSAAKQQSFGDSLLAQYKVSAGTFTDISANLRDLDLTTGKTFTYASGDEIYIGWTRPFTSFHFDSGEANTTARTMTVAIGTGASAFTSITVRDFTSLGGATFGQSGDVVMMADPVAAGWVQNTINSITAYWVKITVSGAMTEVQWVSTQISPWYPSVDATAFPLDGLDRSGAFPHLLFGRMDGSTPVWHDLYSLSEPDDIGVVIFANVGGSNVNHTRALLAIGRFCVWQIQIADNDHPGSEAQPWINAVGLIEGASDVPSEMAPHRAIVRVSEFRIGGIKTDPSLPIALYYTWDSGKRWSKVGTTKHLPAVMQGDSTNSDRGYRFRWAIGFSQAAAAALGSAPVITDVEADFEVLPLPLGATQDRSVRSQPVI